MSRRDLIHRTRSMRCIYGEQITMHQFVSTAYKTYIQINMREEKSTTINTQIRCVRFALFDAKHLAHNNGIS